jgi:hypothetical protein
MADSYPNIIHIVEHKLSACLPESDLLSQSDQQSDDDKQNRSAIEYPRFHATSPKTLK